MKQPRRLVAATATVVLIVGLPVTMLAVFGLPIHHAPAWSRIEHGLTHRVPAASYYHLIEAIPWLVWLWLVAGFFAQAAQILYGRAPKRVRFLGLSQDLAAKVMLLAGGAPNLAARQREAILRGAVEHPRNLTLDERSEFLRAQRRQGVIPNRLRSHGILPKELLPVSYQTDPDAIWWLDTGLRYAAAHGCEVAIHRAKLGATVAVWHDEAAELPAPWERVQAVTTYSFLQRVPNVARIVAPAATHDQHFADRLVPVGCDELGNVILGHGRSEDDDLFRRFDPEVMAQWLALVPWLDNLYVVTLGTWATGKAAPAHIHVATQEELLPLLPTDKHIVVLTDQPRDPCGPLARPNVQWIGPSVQQLGNLEWMPMQARHRIDICEVENG